VWRRSRIWLNKRDVVDLGSNLVQPRSSRGIYSAYVALTSAELAVYTKYIR